jgi:folate-binding protein YgfZ
VEVQKKELSGFFTWLGPPSAASTVLPQLLGNDDAALTSLPAEKQCHPTSSSSSNLIVAEGTGVALSGYTLLALRDLNTNVTAAALSADVRVGGPEEWQALRLLQGRPYPDKELTLDVTPLEAGLWHTVDFEKGCYLGQETLAKQANNKGERQKLYAVRGRGLKEGERIVDAEGNRAGVITSCINEMGLAYIRKTVPHPTTDILFVNGEAQQLQVLDIPYATRTATVKKAIATTVAAAAAAVDAAAANASAADKAAEAERKAKKLEEMKKRLEAFQARNKK